MPAPEVLAAAAELAEEVGMLPLLTVRFESTGKAHAKSLQNRVLACCCPAHLLRLQEYCRRSLTSTGSGSHLWGGAVPNSLLVCAHARYVFSAGSSQMLRAMQAYVLAASPPCLSQMLVIPQPIPRHFSEVPFCHNPSGLRPHADALQSLPAEL